MILIATLRHPLRYFSTGVSLARARTQVEQRRRFLSHTSRLPPARDRSLWRARIPEASSPPGSDFFRQLRKVQRGMRDTRAPDTIRNFMTDLINEGSASLHARRIYPACPATLHFHVRSIIEFPDERRTGFSLSFSLSRPLLPFSSPSLRESSGSRGLLCQLTPRISSLVRVGVNVNCKKFADDNDRYPHRSLR